MSIQRVPTQPQIIRPPPQNPPRSYMYRGGVALHMAPMTTLTQTDLLTLKERRRKKKPAPKPKPKRKTSKTKKKTKSRSKKK